jgi:deazaflavin-dependent oxidoreductase (nitroreductase family)
VTDHGDWNANIIKEFRENGGKVASFARQPLLLLHMTGARSGEPRVKPLAYRAEGDKLYVFASMGGRPSNPAWYHNVLANPKVTVEFGDETFEAVASEVTGAERDEIYARQAAFNPNFAAYQERTTRQIPVIALTRA